jgi:serine/threonine protein kinase/tetratricopeptide (TPR) repeat protein
MTSSDFISPIPLGPFVLQKSIGEGGMGIVWSGLHPTTGVRVAVKVLRSERAWDERQVELFRTEVRAVAELDHRGIVMVLDHGTIDEESAELSKGRLVAGSPYLAMELASGGTLFQHVGRLKWDPFHEILDGTLRGLAHAHARGVIHRDIKPSNIIRSAESDLRPGPKLTDFGIAQLQPSPQEEASRDANFAGSPSYISPEQFQAKHRDVGPWSDLYSLGCTFWACSTGDTPYRAKKLVDMLELHVRGELPTYQPILDVPEGFEQWLRKLLQPKIHNRFQSAADALHALESLAGRPRLQAERLFTPSEEDDIPTVQEPAVTLNTPTLQREPAEPLTHRGRTPTPIDWRDPLDESPPVRLLGAGLGLYGLRRVPLIGRTRERDLLWSRLRSVVDSGRAGVVILRGSSGHGKTRLAQWLCERAHEVGAAHSVRAVHGPIPAPPQGLGPMLARLLRSHGLEREEVLARTRRRLKHLGWPRHYLWNALTELISPSEQTEVSQVGYRFPSPEERYVMIATYLELEARQRPLLLWMDDVQWGGDAIALAHHTLERTEEDPMPVLSVLTVRDDEISPGSFEDQQLAALTLHPDVLDIRLEALDSSQSQALVTELLGLENDLCRQVIERAEGNPLFAIQLVGDWVARGVLSVGSSGFGLSPGASVSIPDDIHAMWADRFRRMLDGHSDGARIALEIASALGPAVDWNEWRGVCQAAGVAIRPGVLESLAAEGLVRPDPQGWAFGHGMARESLERGSREAGRWSSIHSACADYLQGQTGRQVNERIGLHLAETERYSAAASRLLAAARDRMESAEFAMARSLLDTRDSVLDRHLRGPQGEERTIGDIARASLQRLEGKLDEALSRSGTLLQRAREEGWKEVLPAALHEHGSSLLAKGRLREAALELESARSGFEATNDLRAASEASVTLGYTLRDLGELRSAAHAFEEAIEMGGAWEEGLELPAALMGLGNVLIAQGDYLGAEESLLRSMGLLEQAGQLQGLARAWITLSVLLTSKGDLEEAAELAARARELRERFDNPKETATCCNQQGEVFRIQGKLAEAEEAYLTALRLFEDIGSPWSFMPRVNLALVRMEQGRLSLARSGLEAAWLDVRRAGRAAVAQHIDALLLPCYAADGNWIAWDERMDRVREFSEGKTLVDSDSARCLDEAAELAMARGEHERATEARALARRHRNALGDQGA